MTEKLEIVRLKGQEILPYIPDIAKLRIEVFNEYPYLYIGNLEYETKYLQVYAVCPESIIVLVRNKDQIVGVSTAIPLEFETSEFKKPFLDHRMEIQKIFYLGESVLLKPYRGQKVYRQFFQEREAAARDYGCKTTAFCGVERSDDDPRRPKDFTPLDKVWQHFGYVKHPELYVHFEWPEVGEQMVTRKQLTFWLKTL